MNGLSFCIKLTFRQWYYSVYPLIYLRTHALNSNGLWLHTVWAPFILFFSSSNASFPRSSHGALTEWRLFVLWLEVEAFSHQTNTNSPQHRIIARVTAAARTFLDFNFISFTSHITQCVVFVCVCNTTVKKNNPNQKPFGMDVSRTTLSIAAGVAGTLFLGYCIYFDKKRRSDPEYKKKIRERKFSNCVLCVQISINRLNNMRGCVCLRFYFHWHREAPATQVGRRIGSPVRHA